MSVRNSPLSPLSLGDSEWTNIPKYPTLETVSPYRSNWSGLTTPPTPFGYNTMNVLNSGRGIYGLNGGSGSSTPPSSIARSSGGTPKLAQRESDMGKEEENFERILSEHYYALKNYLSQLNNDDNGIPKPNRAREKLLRLSPVQFLELSTDVFDELDRRQQFERRYGSSGGPSYLLPKESFHPKRNQARKKLCSLPIARFTELVTDVFYETERRIPRFANEDDRVDSPIAFTGAASPRIDMSPNESGLRRPSNINQSAKFTRRESNSSTMPVTFDSLASPSPMTNEFKRPTLKSFQSNTIVPNKGTIVEDDETGDDGEEYVEEEVGGDEDVFRSEKTTHKNQIMEKNGDSIETMKEQIKNLNEILSTMEGKLKQKDDDLSRVIEKQNEKVTEMDFEKKKLQELTLKLETKLSDAQSLNKSLKLELDRVKAAHAETNQDLQTQLQQLKLSETKSEKLNASLKAEREKQISKEYNSQQQGITEDVRLQAQEILKEMRILSEQSCSSNEREEYYTTTIKRLELEIEDWKNRYVKMKTKFRSFQSSSSDPAIQRDILKIVCGSDDINTNGMVKDINVIKFQISIDELLRDSRIQEPAKALELTKNVVLNVRNISQDIVEATSNDMKSTLEQKKLLFGITITTKNLIVATRNFAISKGLSPVSLLDAAVSHLASAVIELLRIVKIRSASQDELEDDEKELVSNSTDTNDDSLVRKPDLKELVSPQSNIGPRPARSFASIRLSSNSSMYSPINSPRHSDATSSVSPKHESWANRKISLSRSVNNGFRWMDSLPSMSVVFSSNSQGNDLEQLKLYLEDQTALLVQSVQSLVTAIRSESGITATTNIINTISDVVGKVISSTEKSMLIVENTKLRAQGEVVIKNLIDVRKRLNEAGTIGRQIADEGRDDDESERAWRNWNQSLTPIAFEIAREMKELVIRVDAIDMNEDNHINMDIVKDI
ncbi:SpaA/cell polarity protein [Golovinomyces cichoracearum]|uniref:SpaA/cell polarity protein n=1 Tax=Golovinomyces cichoracearum TaxID=62708 RepID=A0A420IAJ5_9PEZI|nr:SpaA/cell polarity protein [Golovinomyces cichoracearum]